MHIWCIKILKYSLTLNKRVKMKSKRLYNLDILTWIILIEITELLYNSLFNFYFIIADFTKLPSSLITPPRLHWEVRL